MRCKKQSEQKKWYFHQCCWYQFCSLSKQHETVIKRRKQKVVYFVFRSGHVYTSITSKVGSPRHSQFNIIAFQSEFITSNYFVKAGVAKEH